MIPDRLIAHNFRPICPGGDELSCYLEREWCADRGFLNRKGGGEEPTRVDRAKLRVDKAAVKPKEARLRSPQL